MYGDNTMKVKDNIITLGKILLVFYTLVTLYFIGLTANEFTCAATKFSAQMPMSTEHFLGIFLCIAFDAGFILIAVSIFFIAMSIKNDNYMSIASRLSIVGSILSVSIYKFFAFFPDITTSEGFKWVSANTLPMLVPMLGVLLFSTILYQKVVRKEKRNLFTYQSVTSWMIVCAIALSSIYSSVLYTKAVDKQNALDNSVDSSGFPDIDTYDYAGNHVTTDIFKGHKVTMINVWATFCGPCIEEMPILEELSREYSATDFQLIGLCADTIKPNGADDELKYPLALDIVDRTGITYTCIKPTPELISGVLASVQAYPTTFFVDEEGAIFASCSGTKSKIEWRNYINEILSKQ